MFAAAGSTLARVRTGPRLTFALAMALVAVVTAILNLDTSVFFLTPVLLHLARARGSDETPYLYGAVLMSNASSLVLPGANLTNLIVLQHEHVSGSAFAARMWTAAVAAAAVTVLLMLALFRRELDAPRSGDDAADDVRFRIGVGAVAVAAATALVLLLRAPALPVLGVGIVAILVARAPRARVRAAVDVRMLGGLLVLAVALGGLGRWWHGPERLLDSLGRWQTAAAGALAAVGLNNLPAAVLFTPDAPLHPRALLIGLNLGPNLAVTGSLSALLWLRVARSLDAKPSVWRYSKLGVVIAPLSIAAAVGALWLLAPGRL